MRNTGTIGILLMGALFLTACGGGSAGTPTAATAAKPDEQMNMTTAPAPAANGAAFATSNLTVTPDKAKPGDRVMVGVTVANTGTEQGTYTVTVKDHDGKLLGTKDVTLAGGAKEDVSLHISVNTTGTHMVMIDKLYHNLVIEQAAAPPPTQPVQPAPTPPAGTAAVFTVSALDVEPSMPDVGENVTVSFKVYSAQGGTYHAEVKIDGTVVATKDVTVAAGQSQSVNVLAKAPSKEGTFTFSVGDQSLRITVMAM